MSVIDNLITDRTQSDVSRWSELKSKGWSGMTEPEKAEWSAGMKGAYKYTDLNRVNEAMVYLQNRLRGYGYLVDVTLPVIEDVEEGTWSEFQQPTLTGDGTLGVSDFAVASNRVTTGYEAWKAFGADSSQVYSSDVNPSTQVVTYTIYSKTAIKVAGITFSNVPSPLTSSSPAQFTVEAGNNNSDWETLGSFSNSNNDSGSEWSINLTNGKAYQYYRLSIMAANTTNAYVNIGKITLSAEKYILSGGRLPTGYQEVEYIQSSGTQYIDTGFKPNSNTRVVMDFEVLAPGTATCAIFGARDGTSAGSGNGFCLWNLSGTRFRTDYNSDTEDINVVPLGRHTVNKNKNVTTLDSITVTNNTSTFTSKYNFVLYTVNGADTIDERRVSAKLYSCQIYDNGALIRDFAPAKNSDGTVGLYDLVNDAFYTNAGTGTFTAGPDVGTQPTITTRPYWAEGDIPKQSQMEQYLQNVSNIRAVLEVLQTTPPVPSDMVGLTFGEANDIEHILTDVETVINRVVAGFFRSNAFTVICGNRPLPSAQSDLGRTWDDIDAEELTWDDLDDHGSSWYVIQYGVLKGTAVGIL